MVLTYNLLVTLTCDISNFMITFKSINSEYFGLSVKLSQHNSIHAPSTEDSKGQLNSE